MTGAQVREARALLNWSQTKLERVCGFPGAVIIRFENSGIMPNQLGGGCSAEQRLAILRSALEKAGIEFRNHEVRGVKLRKVVGVTGAQVRAARQLLGMTRLELASRCRLHDETIRIFETTDRMPQPMFQRTNPEDRVGAIRAALEAAGVEFIEQNGGGSGVRLNRGAS